tara:strand:+ start:202 stop:489 length:288 start_codon:yes stop_codon:yes gene_type:complete
MKYEKALQLPRGVSYCGKKYRARINYQGTRVDLGIFTDKLKASNVYESYKRFIELDKRRDKRGSTAEQLSSKDWIASNKFIIDHKADLTEGSDFW